MEFPSEIFAEISEVAQEFISKLLEKDPRYVTGHLSSTFWELSKRNVTDIFQDSGYLLMALHDKLS